MTHTACGVGGYVQEDYPYDNAGPGPARSWHFEGGTFVDRSSGYADVMSYCSPQLASDFNYQQMVLYFQSSFRQAELAEGDVCRAESAASPQSIAIVGTVQHDGSVTITGTAPSVRSPLPPPRGGSGLWLTVSAGRRRAPSAAASAARHRSQRRSGRRALDGARAVAARLGI